MARVAGHGRIALLLRAVDSWGITLIYVDQREQSVRQDLYAGPGLIRNGRLWRSAQCAGDGTLPLLSLKLDRFRQVDIQA